MLCQPQLEESWGELEPIYVLPGPQSNIEVKPDTDEQALVQAATNPNVAISAPLRIKLLHSHMQLCNSEWHD